MVPSNHVRNYITPDVKVALLQTKTVLWPRASPNVYSWQILKKTRFVGLEGGRQICSKAPLVGTCRIGCPRITQRFLNSSRPSAQIQMFLAGFQSKTRIFVGYHVFHVRHN